MPIIDKRYQQWTPSDWDDFAKAWLAELRDSSSEPESSIGMSVTMMNFTAAPEHQWQFILAAVSHADSKAELASIAAGPMEHLLGWHGEKFIAQVEEQAKADSKFARMLTFALQYMMTDQIWARVRAIQVTVPNLDNLWNALVPPSGQADTVQGELVRCVTHLTDECYRNGNRNWDEGFVLMAEYLRKYLCDGTFETETSRQVSEDVTSVIAEHDSPETLCNLDGEDVFSRLSDRVVEWCLRHAEPVPHIKNEALKR
jgi:hypothetical protein